MHKLNENKIKKLNNKLPKSTIMMIIIIKK